MANYTSNLPQFVQGQGAQDIKANALFSAVSPAAFYGRNISSAGTAWDYLGGVARINGALTEIANGTLALTVSQTNYVEAHPDTGAVSKNTSGFTAGYLPLYKVTVGADSITNWEDKRQPIILNDTLVKSLSDANATLTQAEAANSLLSFSGTLTATRNITLPLVGKRWWLVYNGTGQSLQFIGPTGTGVTVATASHALIRSDGTNIVQASFSAASSLVAKDEGSTLSSAVTSFDFVGGGVTATNTGGAVTVTVSGSAPTMSLNTQTASYTLVAGDAEKYVRMNVATANNLTVPQNSSVAFAVGTQVHVRQVGAGQTTVVADTNVTIATPETLKLRKQNATVTLVKVDTNAWEIMGDLEAAP